MAKQAREQRQIALLRDRVGRFFANRARERTHLLATLKTIRGFSAPVFLFGGVVRDLMLNGSSISPRDVDLVVSTVDLADVTTAFAESLTRKNRFGGLHLRIHGWHFDVWPLAQTWAFHQKVIPNPSFENLPRTTFLNVEAVAVRLDTEEGRYREIHSHGFFEAIETRVLEINSEANPYPLLCVLRALIMAAKLRFAIGPRLAAYIADHASASSTEELMRVQWEHYKRNAYSAATLDSWLRTVVRRRKVTKRSPVQLQSNLEQVAFTTIPRNRHAQAEPSRQTRNITPTWK